MMITLELVVSTPEVFQDLAAGEYDQKIADFFDNKVFQIDGQSVEIDVAAWYR